MNEADETSMDLHASDLDNDHIVPCVLRNNAPFDTDHTYCNCWCHK